MDDARQIFQLFLGMYDAPAFVRRGRDVEGAWRVLMEECRRRRDALLDMVKLRLATLFALAGDPAALRGVLAAEDVSLVESLHRDLAPRLRIPPAARPTARVLHRALAELCGSIERFNRHWHKEVNEIDLQAINEIRDGYNRYYVLEKECAVGSARLARQGFLRLPPVTTADLLEQFPPLKVPSP